jgi:hypothetical protein
MREIEILRCSGKGRGLIIKGIKSKREREYIIEQIIFASNAYRKLYKLRKSI